MRKNRLEKLLVALEGVKPKQFDMTRYAFECGTPSCVFGHFAARSDLQRKFKFVKDLCPVRLAKSGAIVDFYDDEVLSYFGVTRDQAELLFGCEDDNEYATPAQMRRRIRKLIDNDV